MGRVAVTRVLLSAGCALVVAALVAPAAVARKPATLTRLPIAFEPNRGQAGAPTLFLARAGGTELRLEADRAVLAGSSAGAEVAMHFAGAEPAAAPRAIERLAGHTTYARGNDPAQWLRAVPHYRGVVYEGLYPGIDLVFLGAAGQLRYDFELKPGADPQRIRLRFEGVDEIEIDPRGDLLLHTPGGTLRQRRPRLFQPGPSGEAPLAVEGGFALVGPRSVGFLVGARETASALTIDPEIAFSTLVATDETEELVDVDVDADGDIYVAGRATIDFQSDAVVHKVDRSGSAILYSLVFGGTRFDAASALGVDAGEQVVVVGETSSEDFPLVSAFDSVSDRPNGEGFAVRVNAAGDGLVYASYLGGNGPDNLVDVAVDAAGRAHIAGNTLSPDYPLADEQSGDCFVDPKDPSAPLGDTDAVVTRIGPSGELLFSSRLCGPGDALESGSAIALDGAGNFYLAGFANNPDFPSTPGVLQADGAGFSDAFVARFGPTADRQWVTLLGGSMTDTPAEIAVDPFGAIYMLGSTSSKDFPIPSPSSAFQPSCAESETGSCADTFVARINATGTQLLDATYLGGSANDTPGGIDLDPAGFVHLTGTTRSDDFPLEDPLQETLASVEDLFVAKFDPALETLLFSTYFGGEDRERGQAIRVTGAPPPSPTCRPAFSAAVASEALNRIHVVGDVRSSDFPTVDPIEAERMGFSDGFLLQLEDRATPQPLAGAAPLGAPRGFEANHGQAHPSVEFLARGRDYALFLTQREAVLALERDPAEVVGISLVGAGAAPQLRGESRLPGLVNVYRGNDASRWRSGAPRYRAVRGEAVLPGIDLVYHAARGRLELDFVVDPGADPSQLALAFEGVESLELGEQGDLRLRTPSGLLTLHRPEVYQEANGMRQPVEGRFALRTDAGAPSVGFELAAYDAARALVIDPVLSYASYLGSADDDEAALDVAVDAAGNTYITGYTWSFDFPTASPAQTWPGGSTSDAFVTKLSADGSALLYSTYLGGSVGVDEGRGIAVDAAGSAYITGVTHSSDFPTLAPVQAWPAGLGADAFVTKLDAGGALVYSTYLGGAADTDEGMAIDVDAAGSATVTGLTSSADFPTAAPFQVWPGGVASDAFVTRLSASGDAYLYSTYLGSNENRDAGCGVAVDAAGRATVTGFTFSSDFPTANAAQGWPGGADSDAFVTRLAAAGDALEYSTYLGGSTEGDAGYAVALDAAGSAYVTGSTRSSDFPTVGALQAWPGGVDADAFVTKLAADGSAWAYSTYLGGADGADAGLDIAVDGAGMATVGGVTLSSDFPTEEPIQTWPGGVMADGFVSALEPSGASLSHSTFLGGADHQDEVHGVAVAADTTHMVGLTLASDFPLQGALQTWPGGSAGDAFAARLVPEPGQWAATAAALATLLAVRRRGGGRGAGSKSVPAHHWRGMSGTVFHA